MKPHIWYESDFEDWVCTLCSPETNLGTPVGFGVTPQEAYADWKRKTDSLSRIDADQTQA